MKIEQQQFVGEEVGSFYRWFDAGILNGEIRVEHASINNIDGVQRYTIVESNNTAVAVDRIVPQPGQPEIIGLAKIEL